MENRSLDLLANWAPGDGHIHSNYSKWDFAYLRLALEPHDKDADANQLLTAPALDPWRIFFISHDDKPSVMNMAQVAKRCGMEWIALTDHETMFLREHPGTGEDCDPDEIWQARADECREAARKLNLHIIIGEELGGSNVTKEAVLELSKRYGGRIAETLVNKLFSIHGFQFDNLSYGHCLCYGVGKFVRSGSDLTCSNMLAAAKAGKAFFLAHPGNDPDRVYDIVWDDFREGRPYDDESARYCGVEILNNGLNWYARHSTDEVSLWDQHLTQELQILAKGKTPTACHRALGNSDAHWDGRPGHEKSYPGKHFTWVQTTEIKEDSILPALTAGRCIASQCMENDKGWFESLGPLVACRLVCGNKSASVGETISVPKGSAVTLEVDWAASWPLRQILIIGADGERLGALSVPSSVKISDLLGSLDAASQPIAKRLIAKGLKFTSPQTLTRRLVFDEPGYIRLIGRTAAGKPEKRAFTNPIWVLTK